MRSKQLSACIGRSPYLLAVVSGVLLGTSFIPFPPWAIFFCFVPLWLVWLEEPSWKTVLWTGWVAQFVGTLIGFNWVAYTAHEFGHLPWPVAIPALLLFASFANLYMPLAGLAWLLYSRTFKLGVAGKLWALPVLMSIGERVFPMIFDWNFGYTWLWAGFPAFHLADIVGFMGLSSIGLFFNALLLQAWLKAREGARWWPWAVSVPVLFLALNVWGSLHGRPHPTDASLRFLVVQANIGNQEKVAAEQGQAQDAVLDQFYQLTRQGLAGRPAVDFIVWPETAFPELIEDPHLQTGYAALLRETVADLDAKLITGGYSRLAGANKVTNSFFVLSETGEWLVPPYHKTILLAFGEYFPGADLVPSLRTLIPEIGDFGRGPGPTVLDTGQAKLGAQICYEGLFDWFSRRLANQGAQVIVNLTNDSWYGAWQQPYQHLYMTLARAVEVRRPLVRSTNTGISAAILASGKVLETSPTYADWQHVYEIPYARNPPATLFMTWGFWLIPTLLALALTLLPVLLRDQTARSRKPSASGSAPTTA
jgi:apolipoprotein N-acyltransferase